MTTYAYARVSSQLQADGQGVDSQRHAINGWAQSQGADPSTLVWFEDLAESGKSMDRPQWQAMLANLAKGDTVVLYDLSRAGRTVQGLSAWINQMTEQGVRVVFVKDALDLGSAAGRMIAHIMAAIAEFERVNIGAKTSDGIRASRAKGDGNWGAGRRKLAKGAGSGWLIPPHHMPELYRRVVEGGEEPTAIARGYGTTYQALRLRLVRYARSRGLPHPCGPKASKG